MYGYDDLYNSPLVYRPHQRSRGPLLPSERIIDQIADQAVDETTVEIYGFDLSDLGGLLGGDDSGGDEGLGKIGDWAQGLINPAQRLESWKTKLESLVGKWHTFDESGDSHADKIGNRMLSLATKIKGRQSGWSPSEDVNDILARYAKGKELGFTRKKKAKKKVVEVKKKVVESELSDEVPETVSGLGRHGSSDPFGSIGDAVAIDMFG